MIGTDHGAESVTGFFTKFGDGGADILPLFGLNKRQNRELWLSWGLPRDFGRRFPRLTCWTTSRAVPMKTSSELRTTKSTTTLKAAKFPTASRNSSSRSTSARATSAQCR